MFIGRGTPKSVLIAIYRDWRHRYFNWCIVESCEINMYSFLMRFYLLYLIYYCYMLTCIMLGCVNVYDHVYKLCTNYVSFLHVCLFYFMWVYKSQRRRKCQRQVELINNGCLITYWYTTRKYTHTAVLILCWWTSPRQHNKLKRNIVQFC